MIAKVLHRAVSETTWARAWWVSSAPGAASAAAALPDWLAPLPGAGAGAAAPASAPTPTDSPRGLDDSLRSVLAVAPAATTSVELRVWTGATGVMGLVCVGRGRGAAFVRRLATTAAAGDRAHPRHGIRVSAFADDRLLDVVMALVPDVPQRAVRHPVTLLFDQAVALAQAPIDEGAGLLADLTRGRLGSLEIRVASVRARGPARLALGSWLLTSSGLVHLHHQGSLLTHTPVTRVKVRATLLSAITPGPTGHG